MPRRGQALRVALAALLCVGALATVFQPPGVGWMALAPRLPRPPRLRLRARSQQLLHARASDGGGAAAAASGLTFFVVGDWGTGGADQRRVARHMERRAAASTPRFVMSTGDQMYGDSDAARADGRDGVADVGDPQFRTKFEDVYGELPHVGSVPWHMTLGNHDCTGNASAQMAYSGRQLPHGRGRTRWNMPARYYTFDWALLAAGRASAHVARVVVLDTCSLVCAEDGDAEDKTKNDRCATVKGGGLSARAAQLAWLGALLETPLPTTKSFVVVVTHWPVFSVMGNGPTEVLIRDVAPLLAGAAGRGMRVLYFNGHDHGLQHFVKAVPPAGSSKRGEVHFFVSGGGGFALHPALKRTADGAYVDPEGGALRSSLNEAPGLQSAFARACFGFLEVRLDAEAGAVVRFFQTPAEGGVEETEEGGGSVTPVHVVNVK